MGSARPRESRRFLRVAAGSLLMLAVMFGFEAGKEALAPADLTRWHSHWLTIAFVAVAVSAASWAASRACAREADGRLRAEAEREAFERCLVYISRLRATLPGGRIEGTGE
jgi:hypothetical protein